MKGTPMILKPAVFLLAAVMVCLSAAPGYGINAQAVCDATIEAWRSDPNMKQYLNDYECSCSNGNSSPPVCKAGNTGAEPSAGGGGGGGAKKRGPSDEQLVVQELQKQVDQMFKVNWQAYKKYQQESLRNAQQIHQAQQASARSEEERRKAAAREEAARREKEAMEVHTELLGMPPSGGNNDILDITGALDEDARKKQLAECPGISEKISRYDNGIRHIDEVMARNERMLRDAEAEGKKAEEELAKVTADATAEALSMGLQSFVQTQKNLQRMRELLDKMQAGKGGNAGLMSYGQIVQAQKWLDKGMTYGGNVADLTEKSIDYYKTTSLRGNDALAASPYREKLEIALKDFNEKFMYDGEGWESLGGNLASVMGPAWEISFKSAVAGIKATAAGIGMKHRRDEARGFTGNQDKMALERFRLEQRIAGLKESFVNNRCPVTAKADPSTAPEGR